MKKDIIIAGVGGQGIISIAAAIGYSALELGLNIKQSEVHGMSQRGGEVQSHLRLSSNEIYSDLVPKGKADLVISVEPLESLRYLSWLSPEGWIITSVDPYINMLKYPDIQLILNEIKLFSNHIAIPANDIAKSIDMPKSANMVVLGAAVPYIGIDIEHIEKGIVKLFDKKGADVVQSNIKALQAGFEFSKNYRA